MLASKIDHGLWRNACVSHASRYQPKSPSGPVGNRRLDGCNERGYASSSVSAVNSTAASPVVSIGEVERAPFPPRNIVRILASPDATVPRSQHVHASGSIFVGECERV